jgi:hypothetical protein
LYFCNCTISSITSRNLYISSGRTGGGSNGGDNLLVFLVFPSTWPLILMHFKIYFRVAKHDSMHVSTGTFHQYYHPLNEDMKLSSKSKTDDVTFDRSVSTLSLSIHGTNLTYIHHQRVPHQPII